jgi:hypothetical protein
LQARFSLSPRVLFVSFEPLIKFPDFVSYRIQILFLFIGQGDDFSDQSFGMNPTKRVHKNIKLAGIIADNGQMVTKAMFNHAADQSAFCGYLRMSSGGNMPC